MGNSKITKKQHYIPAGYISQFSAIKLNKLRDSLVYYYDRRNKKILNTKAEKLPLSEDWYFEINNSIIGVENNINLVENLLTEFESNFLNIVDGKYSFAYLDKEKLNIILHFMLHLYLRTPRKREMILENLKKKTISKDLNVSDKLNSENGQKEIVKILHSLSVLGFSYENSIYKSHFDIFSKYNYKFVKITNDDEFISGDNPIVYGSRIIIFPINSKICLIGYIGGQIKIYIEFINKCIASNSDNLIFGSNEKLIKKYKSLIINKDLTSLKYLDL